MAGSIGAGLLTRVVSAAPAGSQNAPIALWSEVCQELNLDFNQTAALASEAGCEGIDCPVRRGGQVLPERAAEDMPKLVDALKRHDRKLLLITSDIKNLNTPHAETALRTAARLGVKYYRLGYWKSGQPLKEIIAGLKDLAALNRELGICGVMQNHPGDEIIGAKLLDYLEICRAFSPDQIAIAFDIGHALRTFEEQWREKFLSVRLYVRIIYCRDFQPATGYVALGEGAVGTSGFFELLRPSSYQAPISLHMEYAWADGKPHNNATLLSALRNDVSVLRRWLKSA